MVPSIHSVSYDLKLLCYDLEQFQIISSLSSFSCILFVVPNDYIQHGILMHAQSTPKFSSHPLFLSPFLPPSIHWFSGSSLKDLEQIKSL